MNPAAIAIKAFVSIKKQTATAGKTGQVPTPSTPQPAFYRKPVTATEYWQDTTIQMMIKRLFSP